MGALPGRQIKPGDSVSIATTASDAGGDPLTARIDWGDGTVEDTTVNRQTGAINGTHTYVATGLYHAALIVFDGIGSTSSPFDVTVSRTPPRRRSADRSKSERARYICSNSRPSAPGRRDRELDGQLG